MAREVHNLEVWYADPVRQQMIGRNWDPKLSKGQPVWLVDERNSRLVGEFEFRYYSHASAVLWGRDDCGRVYSYRARFLHGERLFPSETAAKISLVVDKYMEIEATKRKLTSMQNEVDELLLEMGYDINFKKLEEGK